MPSIASLADRRRYARRLTGEGRGFAASAGLPATNNPASLFQLLCLGLLLSRPGDHDRAVRTALMLHDCGYGSAQALARAPADELARTLRALHWRGAGRLAAALTDLARAVTERYGGDLRRLRTAARRDPARERDLLAELPGVDRSVITLFLREVQAFWGEVAPVVDPRALTVARRLGLARTPHELAEAAGTAEPERLAWLVGRLARIDLEDGYRRLPAPMG